MTKNAETVIDGPRIVRVRETAKGPGKVAVYAKTQADADKIAADLKADGVADVIMTPYTEPVILTYTEWKNGTEADRAKAKARKEALAKLDPAVLEMFPELKA